MAGILDVSAKFRLAVVLAAALSVGVSGRCFAQQFGSTSLPLPVYVEGRPVHCPLYLKLEMKPYNIPFDKFAAGPLDRTQAMFVTAVEAIRRRDTAKFASVWTSPDQMKRLSQTTTVSMVENSPANWIEVARSNFDFDHLGVVAEILAGPDTIFVWETPTKYGPRRDAFYVGPDQKNRPRLSIVSSNSSVPALIKEVFDAEAQPDGQDYKALSNIHLAYEYPVPLAGNGNPGPHPVYLQFDGSPMDFAVGDANVKPPTPLLAFMRHAATRLRSGRNAAFLSDYEPRSAERIRQWLDEIKRRNQAMPPRSAVGMNVGTAGMLSALESSVKFVLDAAPVYLVFQSRAPGSSWTADSLTYTYIVDEGGKYKFANFSSSDDLDEFLQDAALFDKSILKSPANAQPPARPIPNLR